MEFQKKLPDSVQYIPMIIEALRDLNGVAKAMSVKEWIAETLTASNQAIPDTILPSGALKFSNDIQWARMYLVNAGWLEPKDQAGHGIWKLTSVGWSAPLTPESGKAVYEQTALKGTQSGIQALPTEESPQAELVGMESWEIVLKKILTTMPDKGFERLCACIMTQNGLEATKVTGQTGDGGVDGEGMLAFDSLRLIKTPVAWQCKRYKDKPVPSQAVRDFRGAIQGRAEYGLIFTTSAFTASAVLEARRPGAGHIELVGLDRLIEMMGEHKIGVVNTNNQESGYEVSQKFFDEYLHPAAASSKDYVLT